VLDREQWFLEVVINVLACLKFDNGAGDDKFGDKKLILWIILN